MASRDLNDLAPPVRRAALALLEKCSEAGMDVLIYCTLRSASEQAALYASGRSVAGPILTHSKPGHSFHNPDKNGEAWAFDAVPMVGGKPQWSDAAALEKMGAIGEKCGLEWAGRWTVFREKVHFQADKQTIQGAQWDA